MAGIIPEIAPAMTVPSEQSRITYDTDGTSVSFPVPFRFLQNRDLRVTLIAADESSRALALDVDYSVTGAGQQSGGTLTTVDILAAGQALLIERIVAITQETEYQRNDPFPERAHERALDKLTMICQQLAAAFGLSSFDQRRVLSVRDTESQGIGFLPLKTDRASMVLGFDANGDPIAVPSDLPALEGALQRAEAAATTATDEAADAAEHANAASISADTSSASAARSEAAAVLSETASNLAQSSSATVFKRTLDELRQVTDKAIDTPGAVTNDPNSSNNGYYVWNGADWIWSGLQPVTRSLVAPILEGFLTNIPGYAAAIKDRVGQFGMTVTDDLLWNFYGLLNATLTDEARNRMLATGAPRLGAAGITIAENQSVDFLDFHDKLGNVFLRFDKVRGQIYADPSQDFADRLAKILNITDEEDPGEIASRLRDYTHIWVHGQSLSVGIGNSGTLSGATPYGNVYMPNYSTLDCASWGDGLTGTESASTALVSLDGSLRSRNGEPPGVGAANQLAALATGLAQRILVSHSGHGSYAIRQLDKAGSGAGPTQPYQLAVHQANTYRSLANAGGRTFGTAAMIWIQGETDISQGTAPSEYKARLLQLRADYAADTGQDRLPVLFTYQVASHTRRTPNHAPDIGIAQWELSREHADVVLACPMYQFEYRADDGVHLTAHSSRHMGCYFGKAENQTLVDGKKFRPLEPVASVRQGRVINVDFHVPVAPLVIDTTAVSDPGDYGFEVFDAGGAKLSISSVAVEGSRVRIVLSATPSGPVDIAYAIGSTLTGANAGRLTGARGCLRDSDATVAWANDANGNPYPLWNWSVMFKIQGV